MSAILRKELLELTPQALTALSNAGFVKRSQKEIAAGNLPSFTDENGVLTATFSDGILTTLSQGQALKDASCSCNASGMCRHRVMLVLGYQQMSHSAAASASVPDQRWQPGAWLNEVAALPAATQKRALQLMEKGMIVELSCLPGKVPAARLPMSDVRFFSRSSMQFARCDCVEGSLCEHIILAVQAFAAAEARHPGFEQLTWQLHSDGDTSSTLTPFNDGLQTLNHLSDALWRGGISQPAVSYTPLLTQAQRHAQQHQWRWVTLSLEQVAEGLDHFHQRASHYRPGAFLSQFAGLTARLQAAREMARVAAEDQIPAQPWRNIVGLGVQEQVRLDHLRLVSLGMDSWQNTQHYGVKIWFADPDTGSILQLSRQWPLAEQASAPGGQRRIAGFQAGMLAGGQIISKAAQRDARGELHLGARERLNAVAPLTPAAWEMPDFAFYQPGVAALRHYLLQRLPAFTRPLSQSDNLFVLPLGECHSLRWDAGRQTLEAGVSSGEGEDNVLLLSLSFKPCAPHAIDCLAALLQQQDDPPCRVSGLVSFSEGKLTLEPLTIMTRQRAWVLQAGEYPQQTLPVGAEAALPLSLTLLRRCQQMLIEWLHNGLLHQEQRVSREADALAQALNACGFERLARLLRQIPALLRSAEDTALVSTLHAIVLLRDRLEQQCLLTPVQPDG